MKHKIDWYIVPSHGFAIYWAGKVFDHNCAMLMSGMSFKKSVETFEKIFGEENLSQVFTRDTLPDVYKSNFNYYGADMRARNSEALPEMETYENENRIIGMIQKMAAKLENYEVHIECMKPSAIDKK